MNIALRSNINAFRRELAAADKDRVRAAKTAVRVELFRLGKKLRRDIVSGRYASPALSAIAWHLKRRRMGTSPLARLSAFVGYKVRLSPGGLSAELGFVNPRVSRRWQRIIKKQQAGFTTRVTGRQRTFLASVGGGLKGHRSIGRASDARYFFLRHSTASMRTPGRNIIEPFWADNIRQAWANIKSNYLRKYAGERI